MSTKPPVSMPPSKVPGASGGSAQYIVLAVVLIAVMGGLVCWKLKGNQGDASPVASAPVASAAPERVRPPNMDAPPPPPDDDKPAPSSSAAKTKAPVTGGGNFGCGAQCTGTPAGAMRAELSSRASSARGCYERALRNNSTLQGKMTVALKVDNNGVICAASIANDSVGAGDVSSCVLSMFRGQKVSAPTGGCVDVSVPLNFLPKNKLGCVA